MNESNLIPGDVFPSSSSSPSSSLTTEGKNIQE